MHTLKPDDILRRAHAVGAYYGFSSLSSLAAAKKMSTKSPYPEALNVDALDPVAKEVAGFLKHVRDTGLTPSNQQPHFIWHTNAAPGRPSPKQIIVQFHAIGIDHSIADAVLIRAVRSFIGDISKTDPRIRLNSMGDKETRGRFSRELNTFFRKHGAALPADCTECAKRDVFEAAELLAKLEGMDHMPSPTDHLSEASRKHFESVLEYLESTDTPYELTPNLLSRGTAWTETCFEVMSDDRISAWGSRYHELAKHFFKGNIPSIGAVIKINIENRTEIPSIKEKGSPRFVFVHIGDEAKRESMKMTDAFRHARIPMTQAIGVQSLTEQMRFVETVNPQYVIIMGRKEALERTVILRERANHTETFIPLDGLIERLKVA